MTGLEARIGLHRSDGFQLDVDLAVSVGRTVALLGPNGAGKSTVVAALAGLLPIETGRIVLNGAVLDDPRVDTFVPAEDRSVGVVFQDYLLFPHINVVDNVSFGLISRGVSRHDAAVASQDWLNRLGLDGLSQRRPETLSGGQAQRVALARAMVTEPQLLLLDEPLAALDVGTRAQMRRVLSDHLTLFDGPRLLITHDPTEAFLLADEVLVIEDGSITQTGSADDIRLRPRTQYAAELAGANLVAGFARQGAVDTGTWTLHIADREISGPVLATIVPQAISIHSRPPEGSPRNAWQTTVDRTERLGSRVRVQVGPPLALTIEVTKDALDELSVHVGSRVWVAIKATEIEVQPDV